MSIPNVAEVGLSRIRIRAERQGERPKILKDRRRYKRIAVTVNGRFMGEDKQEHPCEVIDMSPGGMAVRAPSSPTDGERVVAYLEHVGRIEGRVARTFDGGFAVEFRISNQKRERIANWLTWFSNQQNGPEDRVHERFEPNIKTQKLILPNSDVHDCQVIDVSLSGASIEVAVKPDLGTVVILGRLRGAVVRYHDTGFAIKFAEVQDPDSLSRTFG